MKRSHHSRPVPPGPLPPERAALFSTDPPASPSDPHPGVWWAGPLKNAEIQKTTLILQKSARPGSESVRVDPGPLPPIDYKQGVGRAGPSKTAKIQKTTLDLQKLGLPGLNRLRLPLALTTDPI